MLHRGTEENMTTEPDCLSQKFFAGKVSSDQVNSDEHVVVFKDINPKASVHILMFPCELY
jgi:histidine triad (HIT) family protein